MYANILDSFTYLIWYMITVKINLFSNKYLTGLQANSIASQAQVALCFWTPSSPYEFSLVCPFIFLSVICFL